MILKLTNAFPAYRDKSVIINTDFIVNALENSITRDDGTIENVTTVHCPPHGVWEVKETPDEIFAMINGSTTKVSQPVTTLLEETTAPKATTKKTRKKS